MKAWLNGDLIELTAPAVSLTDHGFTVGDGVFETLKVVSAPDGPTAFALTRHIDRLGRSAAGLGLSGPDPETVRAAVGTVLAANADADLSWGRVRITYTSGPGPAGSDRGNGPGTLAVTATEGRPWPDTTTVGLAPWPRNERSPLAGLKTTSYADNAVALAWAKERGHSEAILANLAGDLCEGTGSNVFVVIDGEPVTPSLASGCLNGITRQLLVEWADVVEQDLPAEMLDSCSEVFITSSTRDVHPVVAVGDREFPVGPVTTRLRAEFAAQSARNLDP